MVKVHRFGSALVFEHTFFDQPTVDIRNEDTQPFACNVESVDRRPEGLCAQHRLDLSSRIDLAVVFATDDVVEPGAGVVAESPLELFDWYRQKLSYGVCVESCDDLVTELTTQITNLGKLEVAQEMLYRSIANDSLTVRLLVRRTKLREHFVLADSSRACEV